MLALTFIGWLLPGLYINQAMVQRGFFTWSFDHLAPSKLAERQRPLAHAGGRDHRHVRRRRRLGGVGRLDNFFKAFAIMQVFAYIPIVFVGVSAFVIKRRRPDLYDGSAAQWRVGGIEVLPVVGLLSVSSVRSRSHSSITSTRISG